MPKNRQHQWQPVPGPDDMVKCEKCGSEVKASRARRGTGPCIWGSADDSPPASKEDLPSVPNPDQGPVPGAIPAVVNMIGDELARTDADAEPAPPQYPGPKLTDPPEYCNACGEHIAILPLNSRMNMVACNNRRCTLYRERLRMVTKPV